MIFRISKEELLTNLRVFVVFKIRSSRAANNKSHNEMKVRGKNEYVVHHEDNMFQ